MKPSTSATAARDATVASRMLSMKGSESSAVAVSDENLFRMRPAT